MSAHTGPQAPVRPIVTAVIVAHNGAPWVSELIAGLRAQRRAPDRVVVVDTGSTDDTRAQLSEAFGPGVVLDARSTAGFGAAVSHAAMALPARQPGEWLWLLHDDCAPAPDALAALLRLADVVPSAGVLGPKLRDWPNGRRLLELGVTITGSGNRETGLEFGEFDQGQHDTVRDVLAVSTAGMLVRRDVYEVLGGFDERYGLFRDDVDFGWRVVRAGHRVLVCPDSLVFHAEAGFRGARALDAVKGSPRRIDRRNAIHALVVNASFWMAPLVALRLGLGSLLRVLALLVVKWPDAAYDELRAMAGAFSRPDLILRGRRRRAKTARGSRRGVRELLPPPWIGLQHTFEALAAIVSARSGTHAGSGRRSRLPVETGPVAEEVEELPSGRAGLARWVLTRPPVLAVLGVTVVTLVACRDLLGGGSLAGGALLPAPAGMLELWQRYVEPWHAVDLGSGRPAPPYVAVVAGLSTLLAGKAWLAVDVLMLGSVPLSALTCYLLGRRVLGSRPVRLWAAVTYSLLPAVTGAVATGRLGTCVALVLLPLLGLAAMHMLGVGGGHDRTGSWSAAWTTGLVLAVVAAFVPAGYLAALLLGLAACVAPWLRRPGARPRLVLALAVPPVVLLPWLSTLVHNPGALLGEAGIVAPDLADARLSAVAMMLGSPGGPGAAPAWIFGVLLLVALTALLRRDQSRGVLAAWTVSLTGLGVGLVQSRLTVDTDWSSAPVPAWPGLAAGLVAAGWIFAIAVGADGATQVFSQRSFSWRQPVAGLLAVVAGLAPLVGAGWFVIRGADEPLTRDAGPVVPPYIRNAQASAAHPRALVVRAEAGSVRYAVLRGSSARLGDAEVAAGVDTLGGLDSAVGDLLSEAQHDVTADQLVDYSIGFVYLPAPADPRSVERLDTTPGLTRASAPDGAAAWQVDAPVGALRIVDPAGERSEGTDPGAAADDEILTTGANGSATTVPDGSAGRRLVLAESYNGGWRATVDGQELKPARYAGWAQAFDLPADGGRLVLSRETSLHGQLIALQGFVILVFIVFALPSRARSDSASTSDPRARRQGSGPVRPDAQPGRRSATPVGAAGAPPDGPPGSDLRQEEPRTSGEEVRR